VKLLFDENLSSKLVERLGDLYRDCEHVSRVGLSKSDDAGIWAYAKTNGFAIVSKDSDFAERSVIEPAPPKIIWVRAGNCSTSDIEQHLRTAHEMILTFLAHDSETCLILQRR
jgi:predicted nuclease of predicted toxin-antitoxin system